MRKRDVRKELKDAGYEHEDEVPVRVAAEVWGVSPKHVRQLGSEAARVDMTGMDCYLIGAQVVDLQHGPRSEARNSPARERGPPAPSPRPPGAASR